MGIMFEKPLASATALWYIYHVAHVQTEEC